MYIVSSVICLIGAIIIRLYQDFLISISQVAYNANHNVYIYLLFFLAVLFAVLEGKMYRTKKYNLP